MADPRFYSARDALSVLDIERLTGAVFWGRKGSDGTEPRALPAMLQLPKYTGVSGLDWAGPGYLTFCEKPALAPRVQETRAAGCFVTEPIATSLKTRADLFVVRAPSQAIARISAVLYPEAGIDWISPFSPQSNVDASARLGRGAVIAPGVTLGPGVEIGPSTVVAAGCFIGRGVTIGANCRIGPNVTVICAHVGDGVILHSGVRIGQDGFGYVPGPGGLSKAPQLGRVIIQDKVEIGANCAIDRGAYGDTVIGEGTKIDNLVQIAHNVRIGRSCVIAAQCGISGSSAIGDFVTMGGQAGVADHVSIGDGSMIAARTGVTNDLVGGQVYGGFPARPIRQWRREVAALARLSKRKLKLDD